VAVEGRLTTHVLDISKGNPAVGLRIELWSLAGSRSLSKSAVTNPDGRTDGPLLQGADLLPGTYELLFFAGDYLRSAGTAAAEPLFLDVIPVRFGIAEPGKHYHVPLLLSPFGYSTYRGS
jgi:5-hydroxyisourate hydrolase